MTVRVLLVDDEPDVETLFRQQFRHEVRQELYPLGHPRRVILERRSFCWSPTSICPA
jgi:hypothetical protein